MEERIGTLTESAIEAIIEDYEEKSIFILVKEQELCPKCLVNYLEEDEEMNALSRQTNTPICSDCGTEESLEELFG